MCVEENIKCKRNQVYPLVKKINIILLSLSVYAMVGIFIFLALKVHDISDFLSNTETEHLEQCFENFANFLCSNT